MSIFAPDKSSQTLRSIMLGNMSKKLIGERFEVKRLLNCARVIILTESQKYRMTK